MGKECEEGVLMMGMGGEGGYKTGGEQKGVI